MNNVYWEQDFRITVISIMQNLVASNETWRKKL